MIGITDREHTLVIDISTARGSAEALQELETALQGLTRMPGEALKIGIDCGSLLLSQRVLEKMVLILRQNRIHLEILYARLPQTQQTALGMDFFVKEAPQKESQRAQWESLFNPSAPTLNPSEPSSAPPRPSHDVPQFLKPLYSTEPSSEPAMTSPAMTSVKTASPHDSEPIESSTRQTSCQASLPFSEHSTLQPDPLHAPHLKKEENDNGVVSKLSGLTQLAKDLLTKTTAKSHEKKADNFSRDIEAHLNQDAFTDNDNDNDKPTAQSVAKKATATAPLLNTLEEKSTHHQPEPLQVASLSERTSPVATEELINKNPLPPIDMPDYSFDDQLPTRLFEGPLRSGQSAYSDGHLIIVGDVHGGSELVAKGSILVWGELKGIAQAGAEGDTTSTIRALAIHAIQLRIGPIFARRPDRIDYHKQHTLQELSHTLMPEIAQVVDGEIKIFKDAIGR